jgi:16S rRNA (adenine1518-N6/adenine1519-N6)-dimethyltransferase
MVQREVAERLDAEPGGKDYGVLAVVLGSFFTVTVIRRVPATVFWPRPDVSSAVVKLTPTELWPAAERVWFQRVVKTCFEQRRKKMATLLRDRFELDDTGLMAAADEAGLDPGQRPETLPRSVWRRLARALGGSETG